MFQVSPAGHGTDRDPGRRHRLAGPIRRGRDQHRLGFLWLEPGLAQQARERWVVVALALPFHRLGVPGAEVSGTGDVAGDISVVESVQALREDETTVVES